MSKDTGKKKKIREEERFERYVTIVSYFSLGVFFVKYLSTRVIGSSLAISFGVWLLLVVLYKGFHSVGIRKVLKGYLTNATVRKKHTSVKPIKPNVTYVGDAKELMKVATRGGVSPRDNHIVISKNKGSQGAFMDITPKTLKRNIDSIRSGNIERDSKERSRVKLEEEGIELIETEESYTSGTSFLDGENPIKENYNKDRRVNRGLFKTNKGKLINADINGAYQIIRKVVSDVAIPTDNGFVFNPIRLNV